MAAPNAAVVSLAFSLRRPTPAMPVTTPKAAACATEHRPDGSGLRIVRAMTESFLISKIWFHVFADDEHSIVPRDVHPSCVQFTVSPLPRTYPAAAVDTTNALSLNLLRSW